MRKPEDVLGLDANANEATVRRRYLELVRQFPPDREPERFRDIRQAYDQLRDPLRKMQSQLFGFVEGEDLNDIIGDLRKELRTARFDTEALLRLAYAP
ncbi:MAG: DnaJ domain-containing protein [Planctomycetota bacterium]|nr:DnaJ domain-containing protein [Planctomycetota bacterium]